ncbi:predicted protein [Uncinocarpus reesii 1704]|uniref:Uncharacterized protein n=1 Tax=Uncinocarpus reesii (strain UAMH 1704) TaxID=336963 RepID=C4K0A0_UNCRE|nr:uncharacterized protein UREG_07914 [Uncinocarpus reesii 1704]EEP83049.1 predicted protein [Uncinocarpus reesii 1704]
MVIREDDPNSRKYCDGDIYRNIRLHQRRGNVNAEEKWRSRLTDRKRNDLVRMESKLRRLNRGFDQLLPFIGLWSSLKLGYLSRLFRLRCPEELLHYLDLIYRGCHDILGGYSPHLLDASTVAELETLSPAFSLHDRELIRQMMHQRRIFAAVSQQDHRDRILDRILTRGSGRILSFHTFFQDCIFFEALAIPLRNLLPSSFKGTVREGFFLNYTDANQKDSRFLIQTGEDSFRESFGNLNTRIEHGYRQLALAAMRDFPALSGLLPYQNKKDREPAMCAMRKARLYKLADLALKLGFETEKIHEIKSLASNPEEHATQEFLRELYDIDSGMAHGLAGLVGGRVHGAATPPTVTQPEFTSDLQRLPKKLRCNRPACDSYENDRRSLYIDVLYNYDPPQRSHVTSLAIQRDIFVSFFGESDSTPESESVYTLDTQSPGSDSPPDGCRPEMAEYEEADPYHSRGDARPSSQARSSELEDPLARIRGETELFEDVVEADGFEGSAAPLNSINRLDSSKRPSMAIKEFLSNKHVLVLYIQDSRQYAKFNSNGDQKNMFECLARSLSNEYRFLTIRKNIFAVQKLRGLWFSALKYKLIIACRKRQVNNMENDVDTLEELYSLLDS